MLRSNFVRTAIAPTQKCRLTPENRGIMLSRLGFRPQYFDIIILFNVACMFPTKHLE